MMRFILLNHSKQNYLLPLPQSLIFSSISPGSYSVLNLGKPPSEMVLKCVHSFSQVCFYDAQRKKLHLSKVKPLTD